MSDEDELRERIELLDHYTLLGVAPDATPDEIRRAFHRFALDYHPDSHVGAPREAVERSAWIYRRGSEAYRVLHDSVTRREYDARGAAGGSRLPDGGEGGEGRQFVQKKTLPAPKARPFLAEAQLALRAGDLRKARLNLQIALSHDPENGEIRELLARANDPGA